MQIFLILALIIAILAVIFAVQNITVVTISFFAWSIHTSLAVALLLALGAGVLITILVSIPSRVKGSWNFAAQKRKHSALEAERERMQQKIDELALDRDKYLKKWEDSELEISDLEQQMASLSGALEGLEGGVQPEKVSEKTEEPVKTDPSPSQQADPQAES